MKEKWIMNMKKADFNGWANELGISPFLARIIRNRGIETVEEARAYLFAKAEDHADPKRMKQMEQGAALIYQTISAGEKIAIATDYDCDGIFSGEILYEGILRLGGKAVIFSPDRMSEGYGLNVRMVDAALDTGCSLILTCDNGVAAFEPCAYAKSKGLKVVVTDHHEVQYKEVNGVREYLYPACDAMIDPHQPEDDYPYKDLCGAGVAFRLMEVLFQEANRSYSDMADLLVYAAIATVADVVPLTGENRAIVRAGLERVSKHENPGLNALIEVCSLEADHLSSEHIGYIIGPSFNAVGRLSNVEKAFQLLHCKTETEAMPLAQSIRALNEDRKLKTQDGYDLAVELLETTGTNQDQVLVVYLNNVHESVVGIIAGKIKEKYNKPTFVLTDAEDGMLKGSGRSIETYHMVEHLIEVSDLLTRFGGHKMAAGLTLPKERLEEFRMAVNEKSGLTEEMLEKKVFIDIELPLEYTSTSLVSELEKLEPIGTENVSACFARKHFGIQRMRRIGNGTHLRLTLEDEYQGEITKRTALLFGRADEFIEFLTQEFGAGEVEKAFRGFENKLDFAAVYAPGVNTYNGVTEVQVRILNYCRINNVR